MHNSYRLSTLELREKRRIYFRNRRKLSLSVGHVYSIKGKACLFCRVTPKGFNFIDLDTSIVMAYPHHYAIGFGGKPLPESKTMFTFYIPYWIQPAYVCSFNEYKKSPQSKIM